VRSGRAGSDGDRAWASRIDAADVDARLRSAGARLIAVGDPGYPQALLDLFDPPAGLFALGAALDDGPPRVAMVGARNCSRSGREIATLLAASLARAGACVVSGGARGIDAHAHAGALGAGGPTIAVLGCGIDVAYPRQNARLLQEIGARGTVVSEYPPGVRAEPFRFPARNRIVAALSRAVVVVEGAHGSGSMITAEHAMEIGRDVFAVPGPVTSPLSQVPHALIRDGAALLRGPQDLLHDLGLAVDLAEGGSGSKRRNQSEREERLVASLPEAERAVWEVLTEPLPADAVARTLGRPVPGVIAALVGLEIRGMVRQSGGRYDRRMVS
jgi:DNA processing protein